MSADSVRQEMKSDQILSQVLQKIKVGWPNSKNHLNKDLHPYFDHKQLTVHDGCIMRGHRVVIPASLQPPKFMMVTWVLYE